MSCKSAATSGFAQDGDFMLQKVSRHPFYKDSIAARDFLVQSGALKANYLPFCQLFQERIGSGKKTPVLTAFVFLVVADLSSLENSDVADTVLCLSHALSYNRHWAHPHKISETRIFSQCSVQMQIQARLYCTCSGIPQNELYVRILDWWP